MEKTAGKTIPTAILFTRTSAAIRPRSLQAIEAEFAQSGVTVLETQMHERDAFRASSRLAARSLVSTEAKSAMSEPHKLTAAPSRARSFRFSETGHDRRSSMTKERASIFAGDDALDVSGFAPKSGREPGDVPAELVRVIAEASRFPSREAKAASQPPRRAPRIHRTGRTMQFNARTTPQTVEALYAIADRQGWLVGETLERPTFI
jgi:hypothetical protein